MDSSVLRPYACAVRYQRETGFLRRARTAFLIAWARLRYGIGPRYFCVFRLADKPASQWPDYVIEFSDFKRRLAALTPREVHAIADDKARFYLFCRDHGLATIPIEFIVQPPAAEPCPGIPTVSAAEEFRVALDRCPDRLFFKPVDGVWGEGAFRVDRRQDGYEFDGRRGSADEAFRFVAAKLDGTRGYVAQPRVENHPAFRAVTSAAGLATVRIVTGRRDDTIRVLYAVMKLTVGNNVTDNFHHGTNATLGCDDGAGHERPPGAAAAADHRLGRRDHRGRVIDRRDQSAVRIRHRADRERPWHSPRGDGGSRHDLIAV